MNCQNCQKPATVHLTDLITEASGRKYPVEIHLCVEHAIAAGYLPPLPQPPAMGGAQSAGKAFHPSDPPTAIVPAPAAPMGLSVSRKSPAATPADALTCPACGNTWASFKQTGLIGCPNDYQLFAPKLLPLIQRTQENASQHLGKLPPEHAHTDHARQIAITRLRRELQSALDGEHYEQAAQLRDQLKSLDA